MKTLVLVRHAKSSWADPATDDHDRPLDDRGRRDAPRMGRLLHDGGIRPDVLLSSSALRASTTAELMAAELGGIPVTVDDTLYGASPDVILRRVAAVSDDLDSVMLVAHDPGISDLAAQFSDRIDRMPTAAVAIVRLDVRSWGDVAGATPIDVEFHTPKGL